MPGWFQVSDDGSHYLGVGIMRTEMYPEGEYTARISDVECFSSPRGGVVRLLLDMHNGGVFAFMGGLQYQAICIRTFGENHNIPEGPTWLENRWVKFQIKHEKREGTIFESARIKELV